MAVFPKKLLQEAGIYLGFLSHEVTIREAFISLLGCEIIVQDVKEL